jgi:hypothetical protein
MEGKGMGASNFTVWTKFKRKSRNEKFHSGFNLALGSRD